MSDNEKIIDYLNQILRNELTAINQYFMHSRILEYQGFKKLADKEREESIDEMKHADVLMERILFLGGLPNLQDLNKLMIGENAKEMLECDLKLEEDAIGLLKEAAEFMEEKRDFTSATIAQDILASEEEHYDWLRKQLNIIENTGIENYLQSQV